MAIKVNNAKVDWAGYEFCRMTMLGEVIEIGDLNELRDNMELYGGTIMFRALYHSEWMPTIERATGALPG